MTRHAHGHRRRRTPDPLMRVAFWQGLCFLLLVLLIWFNEYYDLSALWFHTKPQAPNLVRGWVLTIGVAITAFVTVAHTYEQQRHIISGLLTVCSQCRKIRLNREVWEAMDDYLSDHSLALITHGICPECFAVVKREIDTLDVGTLGSRASRTAGGAKPGESGER